MIKGTWLYCVITFREGKKEGIVMVPTGVMRRMIEEAATFAKKEYGMKHPEWVSIYPAMDWYKPFPTP